MRPGADAAQRPSVRGGRREALEAHALIAHHRFSGPRPGPAGFTFHDWRKRPASNRHAGDCADSRLAGGRVCQFPHASMSWSPWRASTARPRRRERGALPSSGLSYGEVSLVRVAGSAPAASASKRGALLNELHPEMLGRRASTRRRTPPGKRPDALPLAPRAGTDAVAR